MWKVLGRQLVEGFRVLGDWYRGELSPYSPLNVALSESRNDDGSLRFREGPFYRLAEAERSLYLRALSRDRQRRQMNWHMEVSGIR